MTTEILSLRSRGGSGAKTDRIGMSTAGVSYLGGPEAFSPGKILKKRTPKTAFAAIWSLSFVKKYIKITNSPPAMAAEQVLLRGYGKTISTIIDVRSIIFIFLVYIKARSYQTRKILLNMERTGFASSKGSL